MHAKICRSMYNLFIVEYLCNNAGILRTFGSVFNGKKQVFPLAFDTRHLQVKDTEAQKYTDLSRDADVSQSYSTMKQLSAETVRLLSSSQVITSVVSVVKELIENSLDAGATNIDIKLENYGFNKIEVRDNGNGIKVADVPVMAIKHYTSKISSSEDLERLTTYGFRGEALGSICSISEVLITTKTDADDISTQYALDSNGHVASKKPSHLGQGTTVTVLKLFKNLPVRKQLYSTNRKCKEELKKVQDLLTAYGIIKPDLRITLTHNKAVIWQKTRVSDHKMACMSVLGTAVMGSMVPFQHCCEDPEESVLLAVENVLKSLYGPLPATVPGEIDKTDVNSEDMFVHRTEQTDVVVSEMGPSGNDDQHAHTSFLSFSSDVQNCQAGKNMEICLNHQTLCGDDVHSCLDKKEVSKSDAFPDSSLNLLCEDEQNRQTDIRSSSVPVDPRSKKADGCLLSSGNIDEIEKNGEALVSKDLPEISADSWSMGSGFKNFLGDNLEPVKILIPEVGGTINKQNGHPSEQSSDPQISNQSIEKRNLISDKFGHVTAYDLISSRIIKKPKSAIGFFTQECRPKLITDNPKTSMEDILQQIEEQWDNLNEEEKKNYEVKADKDLERYSREVKKAMGQKVHRPTKETGKQKPKLKASLSDQQKLDKIFHAQIEKKRQTEQSMKILTVPFSLSSCRHQHQRHEKNYSDQHELFLIRHQSFPDVWIFAAEKKLRLLNPYRLEEALLCKRLLMNHKLPVEKLDKPIMLTDSLIGGSQYMAALYKMQKDYPNFNGPGYLTDPRLVANGFQIKVIEGASVTESHLEIEGMANCLPYYGISDLKEILNAIVNGNAKEVYECRPLKVMNYLEGEAVRLARQLPLHLSKEDVQNTIYRMKQQLGKENKGCVHGRPFFHHLTDIPEVDKHSSTEIVQ
ncbi:PMS1 protein homolog 1 isoform X4 [Neopsephotus bourkii]|uniref:PMS1 protein homolog 1 isoform X4 n=1 Tax=Neopsephotus bourkii TaxID=309878 RepID=UPI002AA51491|nr:PMS1 protein homolog 1 isoform X4 [Neopsephotus bourkii]